MLALIYFYLIYNELRCFIERSKIEHCKRKGVNIYDPSIIGGKYADPY